MHWVVHVGETHSLNQGQNDSCWWHQDYAQDQEAPLDASTVLDGGSIPSPGGLWLLRCSWRSRAGSCGAQMLLRKLLKNDPSFPLAQR